MTYKFGDRVIYRVSGETIETLVADNEDVNNIQEDIQKNRLEILKIERPKYEVVEEKKELLTEEEKEFLKEFITFNNNKEMHIIRKVENFIFIYGFDYERIANFKIYNLCFKNLEEYKEYTLKELGLE